MRIDRFQGKAAFLSNFARCKIFYCGMHYPTVEHAYQAMKSDKPKERQEIANLPTPGAAKRRGQKILLPDDWDDLKLVIMEDLLRLKFQNPHYRRLLLGTGGATLIEGNDWGDTFWGQSPADSGVGQNHLGKLLMKIRYEIREADRAFFSDMSSLSKGGKRAD